MAEYIERELFKDELLSWTVCINHPEHLLKEDALCVIDAIPAADVVPVVRCGECLFKRPRKEYGELHCCILDAPMNNNDFCSCGERRESDG